MIMRLLANTAAPTNNSKCNFPSARQRFIPRPRNSTEMRPLNASTEFLALLEGRGFLQSLAFRRPATAALRKADHLYGSFLTRRHVALAVEAAISGIQFRSMVEGLTVTPERGHHMDFIRRVPVENLILGNQADGTLGKKHLVAELDGSAHLAAHDQISMGFEDREDLLGVRNLLAIENPSPRLADHPLAKIAIVGDLRTKHVDLHHCLRVLAT